MSAGKGVWKVLACAFCGQTLEVESPADLLENPDGSRAVLCPSCREVTLVAEDLDPP
jgi:LSD1 subclass zinc finger protein